MDNVIEIITTIFLGFLQGLTEPLPISSSGHLVLAQRLLAIESNHLGFETILNFASLLAVFVVFRKTFVKLFKDNIAYFKNRDDTNKEAFQTTINVIIGTLPAAFLGLFLLDFVEAMLEVNALMMVGLGLFVTGSFLGLVQLRIKDASQPRITKTNASIIGLSQVIAIIPGISRSGSTFISGVLLKIKPKEALAFSFLLYIPISLASIIISLRDITILPFSYVAIILGFISSFFATILALHWFFRILERKKYIGFMVYCFTVGGLAIVLAI